MESTTTSSAGIARYIPGLALFSQLKPGLTGRIGAANIYPSVRAAVTAYREQYKV